MKRQRGLQLPGIDCVVEGYGFAFDSRYVSAEAAISEHETTNTAEVREYHFVFDRLFSAALNDAASRSFLQSIIDEY